MARKIVLPRSVVLNQDFGFFRKCNVILRVSPRTTARTSVASILEISCQSVSLPKMTVSSAPVRIGNVEKKYAESISYGDLTVTYIDSTTEEITNSLYEWWQAIYNYKNDHMNLPSSYKTNASIIKYLSDGSRQAIWTLEGVWPTNIDYGEGDMSSAEYIEITVTFSCDAVLSYDEFISSEY